jgi:hypothetical protein
VAARTVHTLPERQAVHPFNLARVSSVGEVGGMVGFILIAYRCERQ